MAADRELLDVVLTERWPVWRVRESIAPVLPAGWRLVDLQDVWLAGPPLAGRVAAADYRIELAGAPDVERLRVAATDCSIGTGSRASAPRATASSPTTCGPW
jgi:hypothetical protein